MRSPTIPPRQARHQRRRIGFTIIESLVLLAILATLTMILIGVARRKFVEPNPVDSPPGPAPAPAPTSAPEPAPETATAGEEKT